MMQRLKVPIDSLHTLATNATHLSDPGEFFRLARPIISVQLRVDAVLVFYHDYLRECLVAPFIYNEMPRDALEEIVISYEEPMIKELLIARKPHLSLASQNSLLTGMQTELFLPIITPDQVLGCLYLGRRESRTFTEPEIQLAELFSYYLVTPMHRIHWEERSQHTHELLNAFREQYLYILDTIPFPALVVNLARDVIEEANLSFLQWLHYSRPGLFSSRFSKVCPGFLVLHQQGNIWPPQPVAVQLYDADGQKVQGHAFISPSSDSFKDRKVLIFSPEEVISQPAHGPLEGESYMYTLSHDLKTPIQSLKSYITLLREEYGHIMPDTALTYVQRMFVNLEQMESLITNVLDLSRVGHIDTRMELVNSSDILKNALDMLSGLMEYRPVNLIIDASLPFIFCDAVQMTRVFTNLISNAFKFTAGVSITGIEIGCNVREHEYEFYVKDNGVGIPDDVQSKIFDLFFSRDSVQGHKSTGIGLTIVKRIIERHHGRVWAESVEGEGAIIKFTLPMPQSREEVVSSRPMTLHGDE
jgi:nitrogen-specific signal transduction histidine kinase